MQSDLQRLPRRTGWRGRLADYIEGVRRTPFEYSTNDCAMFAAGAVEAITESDPAADLRGAYSTLADGLLMVRRKGYRNHIAMAKAMYPEVPVSRATVGDLAVVKTPEGEALGVVQGSRIYVVGKDGLKTVDLLTAKTALQI